MLPAPECPSHRHQSGGGASEFGAAHPIQALREVMWPAVCATKRANSVNHDFGNVAFRKLPVLYGMCRSRRSPQDTTQMKCEATHLLNLLTKYQQLQVPAWHRRYVWPRDFAAKLMDSIERAGSAGKGHEHHTGSLVLGTRTGDAETQTVLIVDGQQRLVTIVLTLLALAHELRARSGGVLHDDGGNQVTTADELMAQYIARQEQGGWLPRLRLLAEDASALSALVAGQPTDSTRACQLLQTYSALRQHLAGTKCLYTVYRGLKALHGAEVELHDSDRRLAGTFVMLNSR